MKAKKAFTMVELLVVIGILGLLITLMVSMFGNTESARNVQCKANLKNLANAVRAAAVNINDVRYFPLAGSVEWMDVKFDSNNSYELYNEYRGWICWNSNNKYNNTRSHISNAGWFTSAYEQDPDIREYCIKEGAIYNYVKNPSCYVCPAHVKKMPDGLKPAWSYVMNGYYGYDTTKGTGAIGGYPGRGIDDSRASQRLLFAELHWEEYAGRKPNFNTSAGLENDCTLQYSPQDGAEVIGFNHKAGKEIVAHIVFADAHVDTITLPRRGFSDNELKELTELLCIGSDYTIKNGNVEEIQ